MSALDNKEKASSLYPGGSHHKNTSVHRGDNDLVVQLAQLIGRNIITQQPEAINSVDGSLSTARGLYNVPGTHFIYYVRDADVSGLPNYSPGSQGKVKKIVTFPSNVEETTIIRSTVFAYQNPTFPTSTTSISEYEEEASFYMSGGELSYDANSVAQNNTSPNT